MLSRIQQVRERLKAAEQNRMAKIYSVCAEMGVSKHYADAFYYRITESPLEQTESIVGLKKTKYSGDSRVLTWKAYLQIMIQLFPEHQKHSEWIEALRILEQS